METKTGFIEVIENNSIGAEGYMNVKLVDEGGRKIFGGSVEAECIEDVREVVENIEEVGDVNLINGEESVRIKYEKKGNGYFKFNKIQSIEMISRGQCIRELTT